TGVRIDTLATAGTLTLSGTAVTAGQVVAATDLGNLVFAPAHDANGTAYASFTFSVRDSGSAFDPISNSITIDVTSVNDAPADISLSSSTIAENSVANTVIATLSAIDPDSTLSGFAGPFTYTLVAGNGDADNHLVTINGDQLQVATGSIIDFETNPTLEIYVKVTDAGGLSYSRALTVTVNDEINDIYYGTNGDNTLVGGVGNDTLYGYDGNDILIGGVGNDTLYG